MSTMSHDQMEQRERAILDGLPLEAEHVPDQEHRFFDARLVEPFTACEGFCVFGQVQLEPGTRLELKTCQVWIDDNGSWNGRRRGTWRIQQQTHEELDAAGGVYCLVVMDSEEIEAAKASNQTSQRYIKGVLAAIIAENGAVDYATISERLGISDTTHVSKAASELERRKIVTKDRREDGMYVDLNVDGINDIRRAAAERAKTEQLMEDL